MLAFMLILILIFLYGVSKLPDPISKMTMNDIFHLDLQMYKIVNGKMTLLPLMCNHIFQASESFPYLSDLVLTSEGKWLWPDIGCVMLSTI